MIITMEKTGFNTVEINEETGKDANGNDWTDFINQVKAGELSDSEVHLMLDHWLSDMDDEIAVTIKDANGEIVHDSVVW